MTVGYPAGTERQPARAPIKAHLPRKASKARAPDEKLTPDEVACADRFIRACQTQGVLCDTVKHFCQHRDPASWQSKPYNAVCAWMEHPPRIHTWCLCEIATMSEEQMQTTIRSFVLCK